jgi:hypothetical protein
MFAAGMLWVGSGVYVKNGTEVGVSVKVAVACGIGLAVFRAGSVEGIIGLDVVFSAVGVA